MNDRAVAHVVVEMVVAMVDREGLSLEALCEGLPVDPAQLRRRLGGLEWDHFATLMERLEAHLGPAAFREACALVPERSPTSARILRRFVSGRLLLHFVFRAMGPSMYPMYRTAFSEAQTADGRGVFHVNLELRPGFRDCRAVFSAHGVATAALPRLLGQPPFLLREEVRPRGGDYWFTEPG